MEKNAGSDMKLSELQRLSVYMILSKEGACGGNEDAILQQDEIYTALKLRQFERSKVTEVKLTDFNGPDVKCRLSGGAALMLIQILSMPNQASALWRHSAAAIRRIRADAPTAAAIKRHQKAPR